MPYTHVVTVAGTWALLPSNLPPDRLTRHAPDLVGVEPVYSAMHALARAGRLAASPHVTLLHADGPDGRLAACLAARLIERDFSAHVTLDGVGDLDARDPVQRRRTLGAFMHRVADALRQGDAHSTCFAPIGGDELTTTLGYVAGAYLRYPTLCLRDGGQVPHEVPWVPLRVDEDALAAGAGTVRRAARAVSRSDLSTSDLDRVREMPWLFEVSDDGPDAVVTLSAFGHFLRLEPRYSPIIGARVLAGPEARDDLEGADPSFVWGQIDALLWRLGDEVAHRGSLRHEIALGHRDADWHLYRGSDPDRFSRVAYRWYPGQDVLVLRRVWTRQDHHEREARDGVALYGAAHDLALVERPPTLAPGGRGELPGRSGR